MDRLTSLMLFVAAVEEGSLAGAARRVGMSAAMAGKHVASLEANLNARLLQRSTRSLSLTEIGQMYYRRCKRLVEEFDDAHREATDAQRSVRGVLRLAAPVTFGAMRLGGVVARYLNDHPSVSVEVLLNDRYVDVLAEGIDLAIRIGRLRDSELVARRLASCRMVLCASPAFLAKIGMPRTIEEVRRLPRLAFSEEVSEGGWTLTGEDNRAHVIDGPCRMKANNMQMLLSAAQAGIGITYGPSFVFGESLATGKLVALLPEYSTLELGIHAIYPTARHVSQKVRKFVDYLSDLRFDE